MSVWPPKRDSADKPAISAEAPAPWRAPMAPAYVYLLADNLDAALAAGEDLLKENFVWNGASLGSPREIDAARAEQRAAIGTIRTLEMFLVARVLKARERAEELGRRDERFQRMTKLFVGATALLIEAAAELGDETSTEFDTGDALTPYLRGRGILAAEEPAPQEGARIEISESCLVARRIRLGELMDLVAAFLDTLELHYDLFLAGEEADLETAAPAPEKPGTGTSSADA